MNEPTWADVVAAVSAAITAIVVFGTAVFALRQLKEAEKTRYAALAADLTRRWDEPLMAASRRLMSQRTHKEIRAVLKANYMGTATKTQRSEYYTLQALPNFIEGIAAIEDQFGGLKLEFIAPAPGQTVLPLFFISGSRAAARAVIAFLPPRRTPGYGNPSAWLKGKRTENCSGNTECGVIAKRLCHFSTGRRRVGRTIVAPTAAQPRESMPILRSVSKRDL